MSVQIVFIAAPPQCVRGLLSTAQTSKAYEVGDRLSVRNTSNNTIYTYRCTVAGTSAVSAFAPNGVASYGWGTTTWVLITPSSWADAATHCYPDAVCYLDSCALTSQFMASIDGLFSTSVAMEGAIAVISVDVGTMRPTQGAPSNSGNGITLSDGVYGQLRGGTPTFFAAGATFHVRPKLGYSISPSRAGGIDLDVDLIGTVFQLSFLRGAKVRVSGATAAIGTLNAGGLGHAATFDATAVPGSVTLSPGNGRSEGMHQFGVHVEHNMVGTILPAPNYPVSGNFLDGVPAANVSDNNFTPTPYAWGSQACYVESPSVYRNGAAPAGDPNRSLNFAGGTVCDFATMQVSPWLYLHNTLTGSRTLTAHVLTNSPFDGDITDLDLWMEVFYPSSATTPAYSLATTENPDWGAPAAVGTPLPVDTATWTYAGVLAFPQLLKLQLTINIGRAGVIFLRFQKASFKLSRYLTYICPYPDVT